MSGIPATYSRAACREIDIACIVRLAKSNALTDAEWARYGSVIFAHQCEQLRKDVAKLHDTFLTASQPRPETDEERAERQRYGDIATDNRMNRLGERYYE